MIPSGLLASFNYQEVPAELRVVEPTNYWVDLDITARKQIPSEAHIIHDVSWVLTQVEQSDRAALEACRDAITKALTESHGPHVFDILSKVNLTVETLLLPVAKQLRKRIGGVPKNSDDRYASAPREDVPDPEFAATYARIVASLFVIRRLEAARITPAECGKRAFFGQKKECTQCEGGLRVDGCIDDLRTQARYRHGSPGDPEVPENVAQEIFNFMGPGVECSSCHGAGVRVEAVKSSLKAGHSRAAEILALIRSNHGVEARALMINMGFACSACDGKGFDVRRIRSAAATPTPQGNHTVRKFVERMMGPGSKPVDDWFTFFGNDLYCRQCSLWIDVPNDAKTNWVLPVTDSSGTSFAVCRLEMTT